MGCAGGTTEHPDAERCCAFKQTRSVVTRSIGNTVLSYIQKEMHKLHTETTRSSDYLLKTVLLLYLLRPAAAAAAVLVVT